ncbi:hypothetical protein FW774_12885 [Pedobacter sp. BS3]|uniref:hypothetical protein n=1 Tax=Pedobacter sp. BS3 TaxID=2567937 RepID=UPI0011EFCE8E|nr:hypothetical protein [Pedobacter sp. BS3]TZF83183.1 hypothetical protein FW774_12885 [Pedobacter sp. BS3]
MKNKQLLLLLFCYLAIVSCKDALKADLESIRNPSDLKYVEITDARESRAITTAAPTVQTGGLIPTFELVSIVKSDGTVLDQSYLQYVTIGQATTKSIAVDEGMVDANGNPLTSVNVTNSASNGIITIAAGHNFTAGDYYFTIKVTTQANGQVYSTVFDKAFHLHIGPLLPSNLIYSPKNQNLVYGAGSKTSAPILPNSNPDVYFELGNYTDKLSIDKQTGVISLASNYVYTAREVLQPTVRVVSNISGEAIAFENKLTVVITDTPEVMPVETIYVFYPTLNVNAAYPTGGVGYTVQTDIAGLSTRIWGNRTNSIASYLVAPTERPATNTGQTILETCTFSSASATNPVSAWMVTTTQDLTPYQYGYQLSFNYYYMPAYQTYMADGRTPTDLEVYISTDYTGGDIQDANGNWLNGTWTKVNASMKCQRSEGRSGSNSIGAPWGTEFIGTPYPGDQKGADPDGRKNLAAGTFYNIWVKCSYDISVSQLSKNFTVAFKVASYFEGGLLNNTTAPGRGGSYFISDFYYKAVEH